MIARVNIKNTIQSSQTTLTKDYSTQVRSELDIKLLFSNLVFFYKEKLEFSRVTKTSTILTA